MQKNYPREYLEGERVFLRRHELAAAPEIFKCIDSDRDRLSEFLPWVDGSRTVKQSEDYVRATHVDWQEQEVFDFGLYRKSSRAFMGGIGAHNLSWLHERAEIGYWINGLYEGQGYISEALDLLEQELFRLGFHRIEIRCNALNTKSAAVPKRNGYSLEGILKEHAIEFGVRRDTAVWAKLRKCPETNIK